MSESNILDQFDEPHTNTRQYRRVQGDPDERLHTDADYLRRLHGVARFNPDVFEYDSLAPALLQHTWDGGRDQISGGPSCFITGGEGTGKSTLFLRLALIEMEVNEARAVWRAVTGSRSEWIPFAPVARVCIPKGYDPTAMVVSKERNRNSMGTEVPLEDVVREVVYYSDVMDLNLRVLEDGMFNVVYPDPEMRGCQWVYEESDRVIADSSSEVEFRGGHDPVDHWWFGWALSLVERGPFPWTSWFVDEVQSLAPEGAASDKYGTLLKIRLLGEATEDMRKNGVTRWFAGHKDKHLHNLIRDRVRWRIAMNGSANPHGSSAPVGMESVPMNSDLTSGWDVGEALLYSESNFEAVSWPNIAKPINGDLKVYLSKAGSRSSGTSTRGVEA